MEKDLMSLRNQVVIATLISHTGLEKSSPLPSALTQCHCEEKQLVPMVTPDLFVMCSRLSGPQILER